MTNLNEETKAGIEAFKTYRKGYGAIKGFVTAITLCMAKDDAKKALSASLADIKEALEIDSKHHADYEAFRSFSKSASNALGNIYKAEEARLKAEAAAKAAAALAAAKELEEPVEMITTGEEAAAIDADYVAALREDVAGNAALIQACIDALNEELAAI